MSEVYTLIMPEVFNRSITSLANIEDVDSRRDEVYSIDIYCAHLSMTALCVCIAFDSQ